MKYKVTQEQKDFYQKNGFVVIEDFLDAKELETWRTVTEDAVRQRLIERNGLTNQDDPDRYYSQVFVQCVRLADTHEGMAKLMLDERLGEAAASLAGIDGIRIWHDQALFKQPYGNPTGWHLDNPYWSFFSRDAISIWVALDRATLANGCLWYMPGTHKIARFDNAGIGENIASLFKVYPEWKNNKAVPAPCPAGSAVFHNGLIAHGAGANMTPSPRRAMTCAYMPDGSTFNGQQNVLPDDYFKSLQMGDPIDDPKQVPLIWKRA
ncbi:MAG: phytanoyl-CoA dioxygenase family protein [Chloroflexi bacterium]|nr:phytanoyl-CoA dioxygenase family protein [Chloroflexota bacterium]